jgi:hypothetical protein
MATLISQVEGTVQYPNTSLQGCVLKEVLWRRVEEYIAWRWPERTVQWIVEGPGEWHPPLTPATISTVEVWSRAGEWETATNLCVSPFGGWYLACTGPYRFTGAAGDDDADVPETIRTALQRLDSYISAVRMKPGVSAQSVNVGDALQQNQRFDPDAMALAMQRSGAADLLRAYRRAN